MRLTATKLPNRFSRFSTTTAGRRLDLPAPSPERGGVSGSHSPRTAACVRRRARPLPPGPAPKRTRPPATARWHGSAVAIPAAARMARPAAAVVSSASRLDHVDAVAEQADRRGRQLPRAAWPPPRAARRSAPPESSPRISRLTSSGVPQANSRPRWIRASAVAPLGLVQIGGGDEDRHLLAEQLVKDPPEVAARDGIDAVGRLVEKQDPRRVDQRAGQPELLLHPAGEVARQPPPERRQVAEGQQPLGPLGACGAGRCRCRRRSRGSPSRSGRRRGRTAGSCSRSAP